MAFYRVVAGGSVIAPVRSATSIRRRSAVPVERQSDRPGQQTFDPVPDQLGPPAGVQPGVGVAGRAGRRDRSASPAGRCRSARVRATWLTHAEISVSAGRSDRSRSSPPLPTFGGGGMLGRLDDGDELVGDPPAPVAIVDATALGELGEVRRLPLGDAEDRPGRAAPDEPECRAPGPRAHATRRPPGRSPARGDAASGRP